MAISNTISADILIVNYNSTDHTLKCLESIYNCIDDTNFNIYVEDNGSCDNFNRITTEYPTVKLSPNNRNIGFSAAVNRAIKKSKSDFIILLNPDSYISDNVFHILINYLIENSNIGIVGPQVVNEDGSVQGSARSFPNILTSLFGRQSILSKLFPNNSITAANILSKNSDGFTPMIVNWISGVCMVIRRKALDDIGLFDEQFFMYWEDADLCKRMSDFGWNVAYLPYIDVCHLGGKSSDLRPIKSVCHFHKSSFLFFQKHSKSYFTFLSPLVISALCIRTLFSIGLFFIKNKKVKNKDSLTIKQ